MKIQYTILTCLFILLSVIDLQAQIQLDSSFAQAGKLALSPSSNTEVIDIATTTADSLYILMQCGDFDSTGYDAGICLMKTDSLGQADTAFTQHFDLDTFDFSIAKAMTPLANGQLAILGWAYSRANDTRQPACVLKLNGDGTKDLNFAQQGTKQLDFLGNKEYPICLAEDAQQRILVGGVSLDTSNQKSAFNEMPVIARLLPNGDLDTTFGSSGKLLIDPLAGNSPLRHLIGGYLHAALPLQNGQIMLALGYSNSNHWQAMLLLLNDDGSIDSQFNGGFAAFNPSPGFSNEVVRLVELSDSTVVFAMQTSRGSGNMDFYLGTINLRGQGSWQAIPFASHWSVLEDLQVLPNDGLLAVGRAIHLDNRNNSLARSDSFAIAYWPDAKQVGSYQQALLPFEAGKEGGAFAAARQSSGRWLAAGFSYTAAVQSQGALMGLNYSPLLSPVIKTAVEHTVQAFPNPVQQQLYLQTESAEPQPIWLFNSQGQLIYQNAFQGNHEIPMQEYPAGMYYLKIGEEMIKVVKQ